MTGVLLGLALLSAVVFPWPLTALLGLSAAWSEPLVAVALGVFVDSLYYSAPAATLPYFTVGGALVSMLIVLVRSRMKTGLLS